MTEFTPARLAELKAVAEEANAEWYSKAPTVALRWYHEATYPPTVLRLVAALEAKTYEAERLREMGQGLIKQRDEARAEVEALDREVWRMRALRTEASADRTLEMVEQQRDKADRRADRAEAAIERAREAATEVTSQGDNLGRTHYEGCWKHHLHCLAAKIIYETGADDDTQP